MSLLTHPATGATAVVTAVTGIIAAPLAPTWPWWAQFALKALALFVVGVLYFSQSPLAVKIPDAIKAIERHGATTDHIAEPSKMVDAPTEGAK